MNNINYMFVVAVRFCCVACACFVACVVMFVFWFVCLLLVSYFAVAAGVVVDMVALRTNKELVITQEQHIYTQITCLLAL